MCSSYWISSSSTINSLSKSMDSSSGEWLPHHLEMKDPGATAIHEYHQMMTMTKAQLGECEGLMNNYSMELDIADTMLLENNSNPSLTSHPINHHHHLQQPVMSSGNSGFVLNRQQINTPITTAKEIVKSKQDTQLGRSNSSCAWRTNCPSSSDSPNNGQKFISFGSSDMDEYQDIIEPKANSSRPKRPMSKPGVASLCSQEHVLAERKRRGIMTQRFLALSSLIPDLKKTDKASILGNAAKYLKELEGQVKMLEEQTTKRIVESVTLVKRSTQDSNQDDGNSYSNEDMDNSTNHSMEIEAKASNKNVLIRIHCQKDRGLAQKILNEVEKLRLTILNCSNMPFGGYAMSITIIAQKNDDYLCMNMKDLVKHLSLALRQLLYLPK